MEIGHKKKPENTQFQDNPEEVNYNIHEGSACKVVYGAIDNLKIKYDEFRKPSWKS